MLLSKRYMLHKIIHSKTIFLILLFFCFISLYGISLGQVLRWGLAQQIFMADSFINSGHFYPDIFKENVGSVSVYIPGVSFIATVLIRFGLDSYIYELMFLLATLLFIYLIYLSSLVSSSFSNKKNLTLNFSLFFLFVLIFCDLFVFYSLEFKPDTIFLCVGMATLLLANNLDKSQKLYFFLCGFLFSTGILFKQQHIAGIIAMTIYSLLINKDWRYFGVGNLAGLFSILYSLLRIEGFSYWTIDVLADDGFWNIKQFMSTSLDFYYAIVGLFIVFYFFKLKVVNIDLISKKFFLFGLNILDLIKNPFIWFIIFSASAAFAGSLKIGGNSGNAEIALLLVCIVFIGQLKLQKRIISNILLIFSLFLILPKGLLGYASYIDALESRSKISSILKEHKINNILYDSGQYFFIRGEFDLENYWDISSYRTKDYKTYDEGLTTFVPKYEPDIILSSPSNISLIKSLGYKEIFSDKNYSISIKKLD